MEYILEIENVVSKEFCEDVISRFEMDKRTLIGSTIGGVDDTIKKSVDLPIGCSPELRKDWQDVIDKVGECVIQGLRTYQKYVDDEGLDRSRCIQKAIDDVTIGLPQIQKTEKNGFYTWHHDSHLNRFFTYILYINDVEDGVGGTTEFLCGKTIQPKAGNLIIFPASLTYVHRGNKLKDGVKYIITNFIYEGPPIFKHPRVDDSSNESRLQTLKEENSDLENDEI